MNASQDKIFRDGEGDQWFTRNQAHLAPSSDDRIFALCQEYNIAPTRVLEVGAANGYRLEQFRRHFNAACVGIELSGAAVAAGKAQFPEITLEVGEASDLTRFANESFDLVICSFVLHWVDRRSLLRVVAEVDRVIRSDGILAISDFDPPAFQKTKYHHRSDVELFTYKQAYDQMFLSSGTYSSIARKSFSHSRSGWSVAENTTDKAVVSLLRKDFTGLYTLTEIKR